MNPTTFLPSPSRRPQLDLAPASPMAPTICVSRSSPIVTRVHPPATRVPDAGSRHRFGWVEIGDALVFGPLALPGVQFLFQLMLMGMARSGMLHHKLGAHPGLFSPEIVHHAAYFTVAIAVWGCFVMRLLCTIACKPKGGISPGQGRIVLALLWLGPPLVGTMFWLARGRGTILGAVPPRGQRRAHPDHQHRHPPTGRCPDQRGARGAGWTIGGVDPQPHRGAQPAHHR